MLQYRQQGRPFEYLVARGHSRHCVQFMLHGIRIECEVKRCRYGKALKMLDGHLRWPSVTLYSSLRADALFFSVVLRKQRRYYGKLVARGLSPQLE